MGDLRKTGRKAGQEVGTLEVWGHLQIATLAKIKC